MSHARVFAVGIIAIGAAVALALAIGLTAYPESTSKPFGVNNQEREVGNADGSSLVYRNDTQGFVLTYAAPLQPQSGVNTSYTVGDFFVGEGEAIVTFSLPDDAFPGTNFYDGFVTVAVGDPGMSPVECVLAEREGELSSTQLVALEAGDGDLTHYALFSGAAAGTRVDTRVYHGYHQSRCYELAATVVSGNLGNYPEGSVSAFDEAAAWRTLDSVRQGFTVSKRTTSTSDATIFGRATVGPICPVERPDMPCPIPITVYTSRAVVLYEADGRTVVARRFLESDGTFAFTVPAGTYVLDIEHRGVDTSKDLPRALSLATGERVEVNIRIDTGIR